MNDVVTTGAGNLFHRVVEQYPHVGIFASITGFVASLLSIVNVLTPVIGFIAACFGAVAGYYSMRCLHRKWKNKRDEDSGK